MTNDDNVHKIKSENEKRYAIVKRKINVKCNKGARETSKCVYRSDGIVVATTETATTIINDNDDDNDGR